MFHFLRIPCSTSSGIPNRLARLPGAAGDRRRILFYRLYCTLNGNELAPERLLLIP